MVKVLGIETSCDETSVAIVDDQKRILSNVINSQIDLHKEYGGVVPELAARSHIDLIDKVLLEALDQANLKINNVDAIAAVCGPGLIGGLIVGMMTGKAIASSLNKPFIAVNHLEAHLLTPRLTHDLEFPYLTLLLSGGHCQILLAKGIGDYELIGQTIDDALGEAFDKVAQMLGLDYPGGPQIEKMALKGDQNRFKFPKPLVHDKKHVFNFSFSGLKTAVRREIENITGKEFSHFDSFKGLDDGVKADICASFQRTVVEILLDRLENVFDAGFGAKRIVIAGGVAANRFIFGGIESWALTRGCEVICPPVGLCTDNGAMVAWAGVERFKLGIVDGVDFKVRARWPLS